MSAIRAEVYRRANARYPDPGVGKDVQYRNPGSGGTDEPMLITDPNTGEIYRVGGARSANQVRALKPSKIQQEQPAPKKPQSSAPKEKAMGPLRKAGKAFLDFDEAYANASDRINMPAITQVGHSIPLREALDYSQDPMKLAGKGSDNSFVGRAARGAVNAGVLGANIASRYALPMGGVTLAGKALIDLTAQYGGPADQPEPMTLGM